MRYLLDVDPRVNISDEVANKIWRLPTYISFAGDFTEEAASRFRENLESAENQAMRCGQEILPVVIDSYGGSVYGLLGMVDAIKSCSLKVATIVESKAMSCGAILLSCGAEGYRFIAPNATVMIHTVSTGAIGKIDEIKASADEAERLNEKLFRMMSKNCGHESDYFLNLLKDRRMADWYLTPEDCVRHNLANKVHVPSIKVKVSVDFKFE